MSALKDNVVPRDGDAPKSAQEPKAPGDTTALADRERLAVMFEAHYDRVWRVLRRVGLGDAAAEDAAQHVFIIARQKLADIQPGKERGFLCAAAVRVAANERLKLKRETSTEGVPEEADTSDPEGSLESKQQRAILDRLLASLDDELREVLVLFDIEGLTRPEVAEALGIPEGTAASRLRRAREELARRYSKVREGDR